MIVAVEIYLQLFQGTVHLLRKGIKLGKSSDAVLLEWLAVLRLLEVSYENLLGQFAQLNLSYAIFTSEKMIFMRAYSN